jgi:polar amino acid transport system substrate-binding protein
MGRRTLAAPGTRACTRGVAAALTVVALAVVTGCATGPGGDRPASATAVHAVTVREAAARSAAGHAAGQGTARAARAAACVPEASSLAPAGPPEVTPGSFMATIRERGYLIAGVSASTYHFGYFDPLTAQFEGFDIDMIRAVAAAIFGNPDKVEYKAITTDQRIPDIQHGTVDIVARTMTILCSRLPYVAFSSVYFDAHQRVLVLKNSRATGLASLGGQKVCATAGSDSAGNIAHYPVSPRLVLVTVPDFTDCLVLLQQGQIAAISTDDTILYGLAAQDPFTKVVGPPLYDQPYGLAIAKQHPDFVRFVNAVLARERADGAWAASYARWIGTPVPAPPTARYAD